MADFIRIKNKNGKLIGVLAKTENGVEIPFKLEGNYFLRMDSSNPRPLIEEGGYLKLCRQAAKIFFNDPSSEKAAKYIKVQNQECIPQISWEHLSAGEKERLKLLSSNGVNYLADGRLEIGRWIKINRLFVFIPQIVSNLDAAIGMQDRILSSYNKEDGEISELTDIESTIQKIHASLTDWEKNGTDRKKEINHLITKMLQNLRKSRNEYKRHICHQLKSTLELKDKSGKTNPGAAAARLSASLSSLSKRIEQTHLIISRIALRREILKYEKDAFDSFIGKAGSIVLNLRKKSPRLNEKDIHTELNKLLYVMSRLWVNPYKEKAELANRLIATAKKELDNNEWVRYLTCLGEIKKIIKK
jgi:hypothetical protein